MRSCERNISRALCRVASTAGAIPRNASRSKPLLLIPPPRVYSFEGEYPPASANRVALLREISFIRPKIASRQK